MKSVINSKVLQTALHELSPAYDTHGLIPILSNVRMIFANNLLTLDLTNTNLTIVTEVLSAPGTDTQELLLPYQELVKLCAALPDGPLSIERKGNTVEIKFGPKSVFKMNVTAEPENYPKIPATVKDVHVTIGSEVIWAMTKALNFCLPDETVFSKVLLNLLPGHTHVVALDQRIMFFHIDNNANPVTRKFLLNAAFIDAIKGFKEAELSFAENFLKAQSGSTEVYYRLFDDAFVNYEYVYERKTPTNCVANRQDLEDAMNMIMVYKAILGIYIFDMKLTPGKIAISFIQESGEVAHEFTADHNLKMDIVFNAKQMKDVLKSLPKDCTVLNMSFGDQKRPLFICPDDSTTLSYVVTPIVKPTNR